MLLNQTLPSATGIGWTASWTGWRSSCRFPRRFAPVWTSSRCSASAWDTWESRATSTVRANRGQIPAESVVVSLTCSEPPCPKMSTVTVSELGCDADKPLHPPLHSVQEWSKSSFNKRTHKFIFPSSPYTQDKELKIYMESHFARGTMKPDESVMSRDNCQHVQPLKQEVICQDHRKHPGSTPRQKYEALRNLG